DSAVAARRALEEGHEVVAVTLELWADPETDGTRSCCSPHAVTGARALAHRMGIPHLTLDLRTPFREHVVEDFVSEHAAGRTPNPCVRCNGGVRFGTMLRLAASLGAGRLATGHYARIERDPEGPLLRVGADPAKDQAYMLARLEPSDLERLWFPLGELEKREVRRLAREAGLPVSEKPESQDLCFLAGTARERFLHRHGGAGRDRSALPGDPSSDGDRSVGEGGGEIVDRSGQVLGRHGGQERFTVGQRRGIGVAAPEPLYVLRKDPARDRVVVGPRSALATTRVAVAGVRLHRPGSAVDRVKLRYRSAPVPCVVSGRPGAGAHDRLVLVLGEPFHGVAPGQTACLMRGEAVVGWATIEEQAAPEGPSDTVGAGARETPGLPC
ncbi:MAG TPA: tRNA 2-thiouridine(34) synthase MnmA, partial [Thermoleophilaceae bacterium]|nr:tRNA 2-thiouridine(34) synthase MnmA [Thermoleophilaceae bacterium]